MQAGSAIKPLVWLIHKDLRRELRSLHVWPGMMLLGFVLVFLLESQLVLPPEQKVQVVGGLLWLAIFFAGSLACEHSLASERDAGCWQAFTLYPIAPSLLFLSKVIATCIALALLELVLIPAFIVLSDVPLASHPEPLLLVALLGNLGVAAVGTIVSGLTAGLKHRGSLLALLLLPLVIPVILAAAEATRLLLVGPLDFQWWMWIRLLTVFAAVFTVVGSLAFEFVLEE